MVTYAENRIRSSRVRPIGIKRGAKVSNVVRDFYQIGALGMFVAFSLVVSVVASAVVVIAALDRAPEAYENEQGLQIVKRSRQVKRVALAKKLSRSSALTPAPLRH